MTVHSLAFGVALLVTACSSPDAAPVPSLPSSSTVGTPSTPAATASPTGAPASALIGEWKGEQRCELIVAALRTAGFEGSILDNIVSNGLLPGVTSVDEVGDPRHACRTAVVREHSYSFTADRSFRSYDWNHRQVDHATFRIVDADTVTIGDASFDFRIVGATMTLSANTPPDCSGRCLATYEWATMVALPGTTFQRVH
jgi:hypothetical protein